MSLLWISEKVVFSSYFDNFQLSKKSNAFKNISSIACPGNQVRFGDHCYEEASEIFSLVSDNDDVLKNADACATVGGVLWYPETVEEIKWVAHNFPLASGDLYHLGYKNYSQNFGIYAINGQFIAGIPFYTRK